MRFWTTATAALSPGCGSAAAGARRDRFAAALRWWLPCRRSGPCFRWRPWFRWRPCVRSGSRSTRPCRWGSSIRRWTPRPGRPAYRMLRSRLRGSIRASFLRLSRRRPAPARSRLRAPGRPAARPPPARGRSARASRGTEGPPTEARRMPSCSAWDSTRLPEASSEFSTASAAFWRCSAASRSSERPIPELSLSSPSCRVTMPIRAKAMMPIQTRLRIRRSSRRWLASASSLPTRAISPAARPPCAARSGRAAGAGRLAGRGAGPDMRRGRGAATGRRRGARGGAACAWDAAGGVTRSPRPARGRSCERRAGARRRRAGSTAISSLEGPSARRVRRAASGSRPQTHTGSSGGHTQPWARAARKRLTRRSSSEWKEIAASTPPSRSRRQASGSAPSSWPSSSLTAIRSAWKERLAGWPPPNRAGAGTAAVIASTSWSVVSIGAASRARTIARAIAPAWRSSPSSRSAPARRRSSHSATMSRAVSSWLGSMRMSSGAS